MIGKKIELFRFFSCLQKQSPYHTDVHNMQGMPASSPARGTTPMQESNCTCHHSSSGRLRRSFNALQSQYRDMRQSATVVAANLHASQQKLEAVMMENMILKGKSYNSRLNDSEQQPELDNHEKLLRREERQQQEFLPPTTKISKPREDHSKQGEPELVDNHSSEVERLKLELQELKEINIKLQQNHYQETKQFEVEINRLKQKVQECGETRARMDKEAPGETHDGKEISARRGEIESEQIDSPRKPRCTLWNERFALLKAYSAVNGYCSPVNPQANRLLYDWQHSQRQTLRKPGESYDKDFRIAQLNSIGFNWGKDPPPHCLVNATPAASNQKRRAVPCQKKRGVVKPWLESFAALKAYYEKHGHCNVSMDEDALLFYWRSNHKWLLRMLDESIDKEHRIDLLNSIAFDWGKNPPLHCLPKSKAYPQQLLAARANNGYRCDTLQGGKETEMGEKNDIRRQYDTEVGEVERRNDTQRSSHLQGEEAAGCENRTPLDVPLATEAMTRRVVSEEPAVADVSATESQRKRIKLEPGTEELG